MKWKLLRVYGVILLLLIGLSIIPVFVNPAALFVNNTAIARRVADELPAAKDRWFSSQIETYDVDVTGAIPPSCIYDAHLSIRHNKLTAVAVRERVFNKHGPFVPLEPAQWDPPYGRSYSGLLFPSMFDRVGQSLSSDELWNTYLNVQFDGQYGYVSDYDLKMGYRTGGVSECCVWFKYRNFQPVQGN